jgi:Flp pilus assembly protein TadG
MNALRQKSCKSQSLLRRGATAVEVALVFPIFMLVLLLSIEAARLNTLRNTLENAVYEGARRGIVPGAAVADVQAVASSVMSSVGAKNISITTTPSTITDATSTVTVTIDVPLASNSWIGRTTSQHMIRSCTLSRERTK